MKRDLLNRGRSILTPVLVGSVVGAGIALLATPKPGKAIRKDLSRFASTTRDQVSDVIDKGADLYGDGKEALTRAVEAGKDRFDALTGKKRTSLVAPIVVSGIIGAGIALLLAPKSGRETRRDLSRFAASARDRAETVIEKGKDLYDEGKSALTEAMEAGKKVYYEGKEKLLHAA